MTAGGTHEHLVRIGRDSMITYARHGMGIVIGMTISVLLARGLGREGVGVITLAMLLPGMISTFLSLGIPTAGVFFLGRGEYPLRDIFHAQLAAVLVQATVGVALGFGVILGLRQILFSDVPVRLLCLALGMIPLILIRGTLVALFQGLREFAVYNLAFLVTQVVQLLVVVVLIWGLRWGPPGALVASMAAEGATVILCLMLLVRRCGFSLRDLFHPRHLPYLRQGLRYGFLSHLVQIFGFFNQRSDRFLLNSFLAAEQVGIYKIGCTIAERLRLLPRTMSAILMPHIASLRHLDGEARRRELTPIIARHVFWLSLGCGTVMFVLARPLILLLYGVPFANAARVLQVVMPGVVFGVLGVILHSDIAGRGRPGLNALICGIAMVVNIGANVYLIPRYAMTGAAFAATLSCSVDSLLTIGMYWWLAGVPPWRILLPQPQIDLPIWRMLAGKAAARIRRG
jgi:O-antigen/teichoic acid export membrane protein